MASISLDATIDAIYERYLIAKSGGESMYHHPREGLTNTYIYSGGETRRGKELFFS